jgi:2-keto-4-pentenoate hydratase/2-oxohepta-3-ene-1,7-dioic acid hydratase in catechol pathway
VELAFIIGKNGKDIPKEKAFDHIAGYSVFQDISARALQRQHVQWFRGKSLDTFAPMGPYLVTKDEVPDPSNLNLWCKINGVIRQKANTKDLIFDIKTIVNTLSDGITLEVGDVIATGTPSGVGAAHKLGLLKAGDVIESGIEKIGKMRNKVII